MITDNFIKLLPKNFNPGVTHTYFDISHAGIYFGIGGFSYEAAGTLFTVRSSMKQPRRLASLIAVTFVLIGVLFLLFCLSFYFVGYHHRQVYGNENIEKVIFNVYDIRSYMYLCGIAYSAVLIIFVPLYNIANSDMLETFDWIKKRIQDKDGDKDRTRLIIFRWIIMGCFSILALLTEDVTIVFNFAGGLAIPFISFHLPVVQIDLVLP